MVKKKLNNNKSPRRISILGSTGTIGKNTLDLVARNSDDFSVIALTGNHNIKELADQARKTNAKFVATASDDHYQELKAILQGTNIHVAGGQSGIMEAASLQVDWIMAAIVGVAGLLPSLKALSSTPILALANKECLVSAGRLFLQTAETHNTKIIPVDSEHAAIHQCLVGASTKAVKNIILTASGGPFRTLSEDELATVTKHQALKHPNWEMGAKISIDSATMMNKGLELIEAKYLFNLADHQIDAITHPQSIIHCLVYFEDGSVMAQMSAPDMRIPIAYSLAWPHRMPTNLESIDLVNLGQLDFEKTDEVRFPCLRLAKESLKNACEYGPILNAANEIAVEGFLSEKCSFTQIPEIIESCLEKLVNHSSDYNPLNLDDILHRDQETRLAAAKLLCE